MPHKKVARFVTIVSLVVIGTLVFGTALHSIVPHSHGSQVEHSSGHEEESPVWKALHASLHHEDKKLIYMLLTLLSLVFAFALRINFASFVSKTARVLILLRIYTLPHNFITGRWLTRGISPYRRFT